MDKSSEKYQHSVKDDRLQNLLAKSSDGDATPNLAMNKLDHKGRRDVSPMQHFMTH